jgi:hypothetical protein
MLSGQRLPKVPVRVGRRGIWFGMTKHRLVNVISFVVSFAQVLMEVTKNDPTKTLSMDRGLRFDSYPLGFCK